MSANAQGSRLNESSWGWCKGRGGGVLGDEGMLGKDVVKQKGKVEERWKGIIVICGG